MREGLLLILLLLSVLSLKGQKDFRPGYIINISGDTLVGEIDYRGELKMGLKCIFREKGNEIKEYSPSEILGYRFKNSKYYITKEIGEKQYFLEYLINGEVDVYYLRNEEGDHYYVEKKGKTLKELKYNKGYIRKEGKSYLYETTEHKEILKEYMADAPGTEDKIMRIKEPTHKDLIKLAEEYHDQVCKSEECTIYRKEKSGLRVNLEVLGGLLKVANNENYKRKNYVSRGFLAYFGLPRLNEKLYFKTGILTAKLENEEERNKNYVIVPIHIGYLGPKKNKLRPTFSLGILTPSYMGGLMLRVGSRINIGIVGWAEFTTNSVPLIPHELQTYSIMANVHIDLSGK